MGRISEFFNRIFRIQKTLPEADINENLELNETVNNVKMESGGKEMNEHEQWIEEQKEKDRSRKMEAWKNLSNDDKIISILKAQGVDSRILENPTGVKTLLGWAYDNIRTRREKSNYEKETDFNNYRELYSAIDLHIKDGKVVDDYGIQNMPPYFEGKNNSSRELSLNENGELQVVTKTRYEDIASHRTNGGIGEIDEYLDMSTTKTSIYDKNGLEISEEYVSFSGKRSLENGIYKPGFDAYGYKLERGKNANNMLIGNYTVYDNIGAEAKDGVIRNPGSSRTASTNISLEGQYPSELGGRRPSYDDVTSELQEIQSYEDARNKGYALPFGEEGFKKMNAYYQDRTEEYKAKSSIFKKSFEERSGISNSKDIAEIEE